MNKISPETTERYKKGAIEFRNHSKAKILRGITEDFLVQENGGISFKLSEMFIVEDSAPKSEWIPIKMDQYTTKKYWVGEMNRDGIMTIQNKENGKDLIILFPPDQNKFRQNQKAA